MTPPQRARWEHPARTVLFGVLVLWLTLASGASRADDDPSLLSSQRFHQLMDAEVVAQEGAYGAMAFLTDVQDGVWSELKMSHAQIDVCRRKLQRAYLEHLKSEMYPKEADSGRFFGGSSRDTDFRAVARSALKELADRLNVALPHTEDPMTLAHLQDCKHEVEQILDPKK